MTKKVCFIISTIGEENSPERKTADEKYDLVYKPVLETLGYDPIRADKEATPNSISRGIILRIANSDLVLADVSDSNPNVFYELAIRNAVKKPVIVIKKRDQMLPFDIYDKRAISLDMADNRQWISAMEELKKQIRNAEEHPAEASESIVSDVAFDIGGSNNGKAGSEITLLLKDIRDSISLLRRETLTLKEDETPTSTGGFPDIIFDSEKYSYKVGEPIAFRIRGKKPFDRNYNLHIEILDPTRNAWINYPVSLKKGQVFFTVMLEDVTPEWRKGTWEAILWSDDGSGGLSVEFHVE